MRRGGGQTVWRSVGRLASALRSAGPPVRLTALLLLSACQPAARRLLLLDLALSDPVLLNGTARPWRDQGYTVEYRRFYPHLARADLERYRVLLFLLGREPEAPSVTRRSARCSIPFRSTGMTSSQPATPPS